eukprot:5163424-Prymnesium_polylepis.1
MGSQHAPGSLTSSRSPRRSTLHDGSGRGLMETQQANKPMQSSVSWRSGAQSWAHASSSFAGWATGRPQTAGRPMTTSSTRS